MSDYSRAQDFSAKSGTTIFGTEVDEEFDALVIAVNSKTDESREGAASGVATLDAGALIPRGISGNPTSGNGQLPEATVTALGAVELATSAEATDLTDPLRVITPSALSAVVTQLAGNGITETATGVLGISTKLTDIAALAVTADNFLVANGSTWTVETPSQVRTTLGLGSLATKSTVNNDDWNGSALALVNGGTGSTSASGAASAIGVGTEDSPTFTGLTVSGTTITLDAISLTSNGSNLLEWNGAALMSHNNATYTSGQIFFNTIAPTTQGNNGDVWFQYT